MRPVVTVAEMRAADEAAQREVDESELIGRAGFAVATAAIDMLGGAYGRRVVVLAGKGNNGNDGRVAARVLERRGARVRVLQAASAPALIEGCDLVIDAAYGTGFRGSYDAPALSPGTRVLAVDIPSGVSGDTGEASGRVLRAERTVTFAALKPGVLMGDGATAAGTVEVADIGVPVGRPSIALVEDADLAGLPGRDRQTHKWASAVAVVAGSPGMEGAAFLCARGASRAGAGMVRLAVPGADASAEGPWPTEAVRLPLGARDWADAVLQALERCRVIVIGPGIGRDDATIAAVRRVIAESPVPVVADADALFALGEAADAAEVIGATERAVVLTPHDGEYRRLAGEDPGPDRVAAALRLAAATGAVVLVKGSTTAVAAPAATAPPHVLLSTAGSPALATAGTGDVLGGIIAAFIARGLPALRAAAFGAHVHGAAARRGLRQGLLSVDLPDLVADWLSTQVTTDA
jgi:ADP-dependent NAD(P)H-hydrate dehydratase / NAD(P)H-hydrate epimerase